jgi:hypothetical protein
MEADAAKLRLRTKDITIEEEAIWYALTSLAAINTARATI